MAGSRCILPGRVGENPRRHLSGGCWGTGSPTAMAAFLTQVFPLYHLRIV